MFGPRRRRSAYPLPLRPYGNRVHDIDDIHDIVMNLPVMVRVMENIDWLDIDWNLLGPIVALLNIYNERTGNILLHYPIFIRTNKRFIDYINDPQHLYGIRITKYSNLERLLNVLNLPEYLLCDNGITFHREEGLLMLLDRLSYPNRLEKMQVVYGREYSSISRIIKCMFITIERLHRNLVGNNSVRFFRHRFQMYNEKFKAKYMAVNNVDIVTPYWSQVSLFSDGTKLQTTKNYRRNYSGHKKHYCLTFVDTTAPDGMILEESSVYSGADNDHVVQNGENLGPRLVAMQVPYLIIYESGTDKGFHRVPGIRPMHNRIFLNDDQIQQNRQFSSCRVTNEHDIGRVSYQWKYLDFHKGLNLKSQPLAIFRTVTIILTNAITCLDRNATGTYYDCRPPNLEDYFAYNYNAMVNL